MEIELVEIEPTTFYLHMDIPIITLQRKLVSEFQLSLERYIFFNQSSLEGSFSLFSLPSALQLEITKLLILKPNLNCGLLRKIVHGIEINKRSLQIYYNFVT